MDILREQVGVLRERVDALQHDVDALRGEVAYLKENCVTKAEFEEAFIGLRHFIEGLVGDAHSPAAQA